MISDDWENGVDMALDLHFQFKIWEKGSLQIFMHPNPEQNEEYFRPAGK